VILAVKSIEIHMDLRDKLKYYQTEKKQILPDKEHHLEEMATKLEGAILEGDRLPVLKIEKKIPFHYMTPAITDGHYTSVSIPLLTKMQFPDPIVLEELLIFDLETTGLAGGTGTYPFLMGFGIFRRDSIHIIQYFLPEFGREISAFLDLKGLWSEKKTLLTYNGKSFDYPLFRNRMILNRVENPFENYSHLDLLHISRRLWKNILPSCSMETIEERIFSFNRWGDIDGALIPQAYFTFLQTGDIADIKRIINHNQQDLISLARLLIHMHLIENTKISVDFPDGELISMFNIAVTISDLDRIEPIINSIERENKKLPVHSLKNYSLVLKRQKKWKRALDIWQKFIENGEEILFSCEEIAKYYEHRNINLKKALDYTDRAIDFLDIIEEVQQGDGIEDSRNNFNRRLIRLKNKIKAN